MDTISYFEIQSSDPEREIRFYENIFGWKFSKIENLPVEYYEIETNSINGGLLKSPAKIPPTESGTNAFVCSVMVHNFNETARLILENGGIVAMAKFAIPGKC